MTAPGAMLSGNLRVLTEKRIAVKAAQPKNDEEFVTPNRFAAFYSEFDEEFPELREKDTEDDMQRCCKPPPKSNRLCSTNFKLARCMGVGGGEKQCAEAHAHRSNQKQRFRKFDERELNDDLRSIADLKAAAGKQTGIEGVTGVTDIPSEESQPTKRRCEVDDSKSKEMPPKIFGPKRGVERPDHQSRFVQMEYSLVPELQGHR